MGTLLDEMLEARPLIHIENKQTIPHRAVVVANHPYLSPEDWVEAKEIASHWGVNEYGYGLIHLAVVRTRIFEALLGASPDWRILIKPIGFRVLHEQLRCLHLPEHNGCLFLQNSFEDWNKVVIFPEGGIKTKKIHSGFAVAALTQKIPIIYVQLPPIISLYGDIYQRGAVLKYIHYPQSGDNIERLIEIFHQQISIS